jgi:hypothetical protein
MAEMATIPAGAIFTVTTGCYSDYYVKGVFRAKEPIDAAALRAEWLSLHPEQSQRYEFKENGFLGWAFGKGLFEPVESWEWHLDDYGDAAEMSVDHEPAEAPAG